MKRRTVGIIFLIIVTLNSAIVLFCMINLIVETESWIMGMLMSMSFLSVLCYAVAKVNDYLN